MLQQLPVIAGDGRHDRASGDGQKRAARFLSFPGGALRAEWLEMHSGPREVFLGVLEKPASSQHVSPL